MTAQMPDYWTDEVLLNEAEVARFEQVPLAARKLPASTYEMLMDGCAIAPSKVAIHYFTDGARPLETARQVTYAELRAKVHQTANLLGDLGVGKDEVVSVLLPAIPESQFVLWGAQAAGIVNPANWMLEPDILVQMFRAAGTRVLVAYAGDGNTGIWAKAEAVARGLPSLAAVIRVGGTGPAPAAVNGVPVIDFAAAVERYPADRLLSGRVFSADDTASLFHTGGTTGAPKLARHLHRNQVFWVWASKYLSGFDSTEVRLVGVPVFHVAGAVVGCFGPLAKGATVILMTAAGFRHPSVLPNIWRIVDVTRANMLTLVPTLVNQVLSVPMDGADISTLSYVASSTAPLSTSVAQAFHRMTGLRIRESWGMTETTAVTCITPPIEQVKVGSSGVRLPYTQVRIVHPDGEGASDCAPGESGLVIVRGPSVFPGYLGQESAARWFDGEWLDTGDLGYLDTDGWLWITGRAKDLIIRGGHNIDPKMVEEVLFGHPAIQDAAVVGAPDAHAGEVPVAYVVLKPQATASAQAVLQYAAEHVPERAAIPRHCFVLPEMPKTSVGKIQKNLLRVDAIERMFRAALDGIGRGSDTIVQATDRGSRGFFVEIRVPARDADDAALADALRSFTVPYAVRTAEGA